MAARIGILGGTGQIAMSVARHLGDDFDVLLYSRNPAEPSGTQKSRIQHLPLEQFGCEPVDLVVNAIGAGDPARIRSAGGHIRAITRYFDHLAMAHIGKTFDKYIFLSSVSVYGDNPVFPVCPNTLRASDSPKRSDYGEAKREAEERHERHGGPIVDLRVFGYVSPRVPLNSGFLLGKIFATTAGAQPFSPEGPDFVRDYIGPSYLSDIFKSVLAGTPENQRMDAISRQPTSRNRILAEMESSYGLKIIWNCPEDRLLIEEIPSASTIAHSWHFPERASSIEVVMSAASEVLACP